MSTPFPNYQQWVKTANENETRHYTKKTYEYQLCPGRWASKRFEEMRKLLDLEHPNPGKRKGARGQGGRGGERKKSHFKEETGPGIHYVGYPESAGQQKKTNSGTNNWTQRCSKYPQRGDVSTQPHKRCIHIIQWNKDEQDYITGF